MNLRILLGWLLLAGSPAVWAQSVYVCSLSDLYRLNLQTCQTTLIGRMPTLMNDIALTPAGVLYGVSGNFGNPALAQTLFRIDQTTGAGTSLGRLQYTINGLIAGPDGVLYGAGSFGEIVTIDPTTGNTTLLGNCEFPCQGDLAFYQRRLYMAATGNRLVEINLRNPAQSRLIGTLGIGSDVLGMTTVGIESCTDNTLRLYATGGSSLYEVDPGTAAVRSVCTYALATIDGAASLIETAVVNRPTAGLDSVARVCADVRTVPLRQYLFRADPGGRWRLAAGKGQLTGDVYTSGSVPDTSPVRAEYIVGEGSCTDTAVVSLAIQPLPRVTNFAVTPTGCSHTTGKLAVTATGFQPLLYSLDVSEPGSTRSLFDSLSLGNYTVYLTDAFGCRGSDTVTVTNGCVGAAYLPTAFSPNGDQVNDTFVVQLSESSAFVERFTVFDRWGKLVYNRDDFALRSGDSLWDGRADGDEPAAGLFTYHLMVLYPTGYRYMFRGTVLTLR